MFKRKTMKAAEIFDLFWEKDGRIPSKREFDCLFYGDKVDQVISRHYYWVKKKWLQDNPEVSL